MINNKPIDFLKKDKSTNIKKNMAFSAIVFIFAFTLGFFASDTTRPDGTSLLGSLIESRTEKPLIVKERTGNEKGIVSLVPRSVTSRVKEVIDGDTVILDNGETVRYIGVDAPEKFLENGRRECYADEATARNRELVLGKEVVIEGDVSERDPYGRTLGYVYVKNEVEKDAWDRLVFVNMVLVREGFAFTASYPPDIRHETELTGAENKAVEEKIGIWRDCGYSADKKPTPDV